MIYQATLVVTALVLILGVWRQVAIAYKCPLWLQYYTPLYATLFFFVAETTWQIYRTLHATHFLDEELTKTVIMQAPAAVNLTTWQEEASLEEYGALRCILFSLPFWVMGNFLVCLTHTVLHVKQCCSGDLARHPQHDMTIILLALPIIYGAMSLRAVMDICFIVTNTSIGVHSKWEDLRDFFLEAYEANFMVADLYESVALLVFTRITTYLLQAKVALLQNQELTTVNACAQEISVPSVELHRTIRGGLERTREMVESLSTQTLVGLMYFCIACWAQAMYFLMLTTFDYMGHPIEYLSTPERKAFAEAFCLGMGTISSFAAIHSIAALELSFGHRYMHGFHISRKFFSAKVLVSLAFMQALVMKMPPFAYMSEVRQKLLYSSALCIECFLISLLHLTAWSSTETWFQETESVTTESGTVELGYQAATSAFPML